MYELYESISVKINGKQNLDSINTNPAPKHLRSLDSDMDFNLTGDPVQTIDYDGYCVLSYNIMKNRTLK